MAVMMTSMDGMDLMDGINGNGWHGLFQWGGIEILLVKWIMEVGDR